MNASSIKLAAAAVIAVMVIASVPFIGFTTDAKDDRQGVMLDFAYYNVEWIPFRFDEGKTGVSYIP